MTKIPAKASGNIRVADITIAQLSRGLYRSNATAFKELVSNAWDADAPLVRIDTNYPEFNFVSVSDNGKGMSLDEFRRYFSEEGVGSCIKRKGDKDRTDEYARPIIGRLGIGMLAIGQLCHSFKIESHYKDEEGKVKAYHGEIVLEDVFPFADKEQVMRDSDFKRREIDVGTWKYETIPYDEEKRGFRIYSKDVRPTFMREMKSSIQDKMTSREREKISFSQADLHSQFYKKSKSVRDCKSYLETIWELSILCPLPYCGKIQEYPINVAYFSRGGAKSNGNESHEFESAIKFIKDHQSKLINYNFRVVFDGIDLRRYVQFPTEEDVTPKLYFIDFNERVFKSRLRYSGYLFAQIPRAIRPLELNGVQLRLREVGIGGYDPTFLKYYKEIETIRSRWVSGEIFVDEGLESALNIDRDSFNEHDEHFKRLQSDLHAKLEGVFDKINAIARERSEERRETKEHQIQRSMQKIIAGHSQGKVRLLQRKLGRDAPIVTINEKKGEIILNIAARPLGRKKANSLLRSIMLAYHMSKLTTETEEKRDEKFYQLVKEILDEVV